MRDKSTGTVPERTKRRLPGARWAGMAGALAATTALTLITAGGAHAATCDYTWGGSNYGNWANPAKWAQNAVPVADANVCITSGSAVLRHTDPNPPALASLTITGPGGLTVKAGQTIDSAATTIGPGAWLLADHVPRATGTGTVTLGGGPVVNQGEVIVAPRVVLAQTAGSFQNDATGRLVARISKLGVGTYQFGSGVTFTAGGVLDPRLIGGFVPAGGQRFDVITGNGLSGQFTKVGRNFTADYGQPGTIGALYAPATPVPPPPGAGVAQVQSAVLAGRRVVTLSVSCPSGGGACKRLRYRIVATVHPRHIGKGRVLTVARGRIPNLRPGADESLQLQLPGTGIGRLRHHRVLRIVVVANEYGQVIARNVVRVPAGGGLVQGLADLTTRRSGVRFSAAGTSSLSAWRLRAPRPACRP